MSMDYVQYAVSGENHDLNHLMYKKVHLSADYKATLCGKALSTRWFITGNTGKVKKEVTCRMCKKLATSNE